MSRRRIWSVPGLILLGWAPVACAGGQEEAVITQVITEPSEPEPVEVTVVATVQPTPVPTEAPMVTPAPDPAALIQAEYARLGAGHVLDNPPEAMQVGRRERVEVRIAQGVMEMLVAESLQGRGEPRVMPPGAAWAGAQPSCRLGSRRARRNCRNGYLDGTTRPTRAHRPKG